jgi:hypothetical protein
MGYRLARGTLQKDRPKLYGRPPDPGFCILPGNRAKVDNLRDWLLLPYSVWICSY